jgi:hypothetical protein
MSTTFECRPKGVAAIQQEVGRVTSTVSSVWWVLYTYSNAVFILKIRHSTTPGENVVGMSLRGSIQADCREHNAV